MIFWSRPHVCIAEKSWEKIQKVQAAKEKQIATTKVIKKFNCKHCQKEFSDFYNRRVYCSKACRMEYNVKINNDKWAISKPKKPTMKQMRARRFLDSTRYFSDESWMKKFSGIRG